MGRTESDLWGLVMGMAREGVTAVHAYRKLRAAGGQNLCKTEDEFTALFERFKAQPLFAAHMLLTIQRAEFQQAVLDAMWALDASDHAQVDEYTETMNEFRQGSFEALQRILNTVTVTRPTLAAELTAAARTLWSRQYVEFDAVAATQLELPFPAAPEQPECAPALPEGV